MYRRLIAFVVSVALVIAGAAALDPGPAAAHAAHQRVPDKDCADFPNQAAAQRFFLDHGGPRHDPHGLDADSDGIACESNPCPCSHDTTPGGGGQNPPPGHPGPKTLHEKARVIRVIDGDTVKVKLAGGPKRSVRVLGIDTPEVYGGVECGGRFASKSGRQLLPRGTVVTLTSDTTQARVDRYHRLLRYIAHRGFDFGRAQIRRGWARVYVYNHKPFKRTSSYKRTQAEAKRLDRGIWRVC